MSEIALNSDLIPIIDFSGYLNGNDEEKAKVANAMGEAAEKIGFLVLKGHGVDPEIINDAWKATWECKIFCGYCNV